MSATAPAQDYGYSQHFTSPTSLQKAGRIALIAINVGAAVAPIIGSIFDSSKCTWLEALADSSVHVLRVVTLVYNAPTWSANIIDGFREVTLVIGLSQFPNAISTGDLVIHSANLISGTLLYTPSGGQKIE